MTPDPSWDESLWPSLGWQPSPHQQAQFQQLYHLVLQGNTSQNLTRITDPSDFWEKHLWDSLRPLQLLGLLQPDPNPPLKAIDIGTGAGFPGIPIAIAHPDWHLTLLDSTHRKIAFVKETVMALGLAQVIAEAERVERWGHWKRDYYDLALCRALAPTTVCAEYSLPLLKIGGRALLYRGHWTSEEAQTLTRIVEPLGGRLITVDAFTTPLTQAIRHCVVIEKQDPTPMLYPRATGIPSRDPLG